MQIKVHKCQTCSASHLLPLLTQIDTEIVFICNPVPMIQCTTYGHLKATTPRDNRPRIGLPVYGRWN